MFQKKLIKQLHINLYIWTLATALVFFPAVSLGQDDDEFHNHLSFQGFTGILNTPNAELTRTGNLYFMYTDQIEPDRQNRISHADNYLLSVGLFRFLEIGGRFTEEDAKDLGRPFSSSTIYRSDGGLRDLSANFKFKVPFPEKYDFFSLAFGMQDVGGGASHFRSRYVVASKEIWRVRASLGYGDGPDRMDGVFGGLEFKITQWLYLLGDYDTDETHYGVSLITPDDFLGLPFNLGLRAKASGEDPNKIDVGLAIQIPLGPKSRKKNLVPDAQTAQPACPALPGPPPIPSAPTCASSPVPCPAQSALVEVPEIEPGRFSDFEDGQIEALAHKLADEGFENVTVGTLNQTTLYLEYENNRYNHNQLDGLGLVLGIIARQAPPGICDIIVVLKVENTPMLEVRSSRQDYAMFLGADGDHPSAHNAFLDQLQVTTDVPNRRPEGLTLVAENLNSSALKARLLIYPELEYRLGTEISAFDGVVSIKPDAYLNLWKGASFNARWDIPVAWTENLDDGEPFSGLRESAKLDRLMLYQTYKPHPYLAMMLAGGKYDADNAGALSDIVFQPGSGRHRFRIYGGYLHDDVEDFDRKVCLGSYRFFLAKLDTYAEVTYGRYYWNDRGTTLSLKRFFGDTAVEVFYKDIGDEQKAGARITLPLTPRRDMKPYRVQVRGDQAWSEDVSVSVVDEGDTSPIWPHLAVIPTLKHDLPRTYYNNDRLSPAYVKQHVSRMREAYMRWGEKEE